MTSEPGRARAGFWLSLVGAVAFSGKAIVVKLLIREGVDAITCLGLRMLLAAPLFVAMAWWGGRARERPSRADLGRVALLGFTGYYLASTLDFMGLEHISASLERLILYVYPTVVMLLGRFLGHPRIRSRQWGALAVSYVGVLLAFGGEALKATHLASAGSSEVLVGGALVLASAISYAVYIVLSGETVGRFGALRLTGWASGIASALCIVQFLTTRAHLVATLDDWMTPRILGLSLVNATVCTAMPMWMVMRGIEMIGSARAAQIGLVGPLSTVILAVLLLGEPLTLPMVAGTVLVLGGTALLRS
ncbi:MAG TPA: DMT family transporter [Polyangiaceae bacterium]|jgi:drug/metabolite transporter (DMT)-like permease|nr:DMT family transporter [Polyangiaceae bacterium]